MITLNSKEDNPLEYHTSRAEIFYREGDVAEGIKEARRALLHCKDELHRERATALRIFIAKSYSALGDHDRSNSEYRALIDEGTYLPPIIMGIMHNNIEQGRHDKVRHNVHLVRLFTGLDE